jgi:hypothetical protein
VVSLRIGHALSYPTELQVKAFNEKNFKAFIATRNDVQDEVFDSPQGIAQDVLDEFNKWRATKPRVVLALPVKVVGRSVVDRTGKTLATAVSVSHARITADLMNAEYKDDSEDDEDDEE